MYDHSSWRQEQLHGHILIGKVITDVKVSDDKCSLIVSIKDEAPIVANVYAECCSETWIESVELPALGFPAEVITVQDLDMPPVPDQAEDTYEYLQIYGFKIVTDRGEVVVDFRNESNGYYGGSLDWPERQVA